MRIESIIKSTESENLILDILNKIHLDGPISNESFETLALIKKYHPEIFKKHEAKLISLMGLFYKKGTPESVLEYAYSVFAESIEESTGRKFTPVQADAYKRITERTYFSFSAPTSAGKSYLFRELIINTKGDIVIVVPSRALISEYISSIYKLVDKSVLVLQFIEIINIKNTTRKIYVITPERGVELFKNLNKLNVELFLFDEAQLSEDGIRGMKFDSLVRRVDKLFPDARKVFTHPFIDNPEAQLKKHNFNNSSDSKLYKQNSVGKIYLSYKDKKYYYFSPFNKPLEKLDTNSDIVKEKILENGTILIYTSKAKIYTGEYITEFADYVELCPKLTDPIAIKYVEKLKEFIGASDTDNDKRSLMINMMEKGIVIHHGSIPLKARLLIEEFVNNNFARLCFSTSTLAQGINMPFDIVWIKHFSFTGTVDKKILDLKNLIGRAGRSTSTKDSFDYGYVVLEEENVKMFSDRLNKTSTLSEKSKLDENVGEIPEDLKDIVEAIKNDTFDDELQMTDAQVKRLEESDIDGDIAFILDKFISDGKPITGKAYYLIDNAERKKIKASFKKIYTSHLRRKDLNKAEMSVLSAAIPILLWQIQGKSFSEIISLRYAYLSQKDERAAIARRVKRSEITPGEGQKELEELPIMYSQAAEQIPHAGLSGYGLYKMGTPVTELEYDVLVYDTYDYIDKVISLCLRDPLSAAFLIYYNKTQDERAIQISNYIKYGTNESTEIWLVKYGFSFDDIEWLKDYVESIDENEIFFKDSIREIDMEKAKTIERFNNKV